MTEYKKQSLWRLTWLPIIFDEHIYLKLHLKLGLKISPNTVRDMLSSYRCRPDEEWIKDFKRYIEDQLSEDDQATQNHDKESRL